MIGKWKVELQKVCGDKIYSVYRLRDVAATDHSGNREYACGYFEDKQKAQELAARLNGEK